MSMEYSTELEHLLNCPRMRFTLILATLLCHQAILLGQSLLSYDVPLLVEGEVLSKAWLGGLNNPLFSDEDLDNDGESELLIFDTAGNVLLAFEKTEDGGLEYTPSLTEHFPRLKYWLFLRDFDQDGIIDLFSASDYQFHDGIIVHKGAYIDGQLHFERLNQFGTNQDLLAFDDDGVLSYVPAGSFSFPAIDDIDGDGDLDILTFNSGGYYVEYFQNLQIENGLPSDQFEFIFLDECWGYFYETGNTNGVILSGTPGECAPASAVPDWEAVAKSAHGSSALTTLDKNADGLMDVFFSDLSRNNLLYLENHGTIDNAIITEQSVDFPEETTGAEIEFMPTPSFVDLDDDGDKDMIVSPIYFKSENVDVCLIYENVSETEGYEFEFQTSEWLTDEMLDLGAGTDPTFVDYNQDDLIDIVVGTTGYFSPEGGYDARLFLFENTGSSTVPSFELVDDDLLSMTQFDNFSHSYSPEFGDLDNDGDLDILIGDYEGKLFYGENIAGPGLPLVFDELSYGYMFIDSLDTDGTDLSMGKNACPEIVDVNGDGLFDLLIGEDTGNINYFENTGTESDAFFLPNQDTAPNQSAWGGIYLQEAISIRGYSAPLTYQTVDSLLVFSGTEYGKILRFDAIEDGFVPELMEIIDEDFGKTGQGQLLKLDLADIDANGLLELIVGNSRGGLALYHTSIQTDGSWTSTGESDFGLSLYPNPAREELFVSNFSESFDYSIYNCKGQLIMSGQGLDHKISVRDLPNGYYILELANEVRTLRQKFLVQ